ncbi:MAG: hypothetical protein WC906_03670 [Parcubacteria group bacterium]|jgi:hypothetical protein
MINIKVVLDKDFNGVFFGHEGHRVRSIGMSALHEGEEVYISQCPQNPKKFEVTADCIHCEVWTIVEESEIFEELQYGI